eukprot:scaffold164328_cov32-Tisochrysis_lutea.AAC.6
MCNCGENSQPQTVVWIVCCTGRNGRLATESDDSCVLHSIGILVTRPGGRVGVRSHGSCRALALSQPSRSWDAIARRRTRWQWEKPADGARPAPGDGWRVNAG